MNNILELTTFCIYFALLLIISLIFSKKQKTNVQYIMGNRSLNFWLTALSAHASDMSSWLFLAYPSLIFLGGVPNAWLAIGLTVCMFLNWQYIAPKIRTITEQTNSLTLSAYFENRYADTWGAIRIVSGLSCLIFYTIYIASGLIGMGFLVESLFNFNYHIGISISLFIVMLYVFIGGYTTIAWIDLLQGFFLLGVIIFIPSMLLYLTQGFTPIIQSMHQQKIATSLIPSFTFSNIWSMIALMFSWGLGYFGQPHIITKFMGIRNVSEIKYSKYLGMSWQILALAGATLIGLIGIYTFPEGLQNPEIVILEIVKKTLLPIFAALVLCAILAATTNVMAAQILVVASSITEDFYKPLINRTAPSSVLLKVSKSSVIVISLLAYGIAFFKISTIYTLVLYAWSGLGGTFAPLLLLSLYTRKINRYGALWGIIVGAFFGMFWPVVNTRFNLQFPAMFAAFIASMITICLVSYMTNKQSIKDQGDIT
jgi:SSS family solute:Na+ symporter